LGCVRCGLQPKPLHGPDEGNGLGLGAEPHMVISESVVGLGEVFVFAERIPQTLVEARQRDP
jgi:hypothetical protein